VNAVCNPFFTELYKVSWGRNMADTRNAHTFSCLMAIPAADTSKEVTMKSGFKSLVLAGLLAGAGFATFAQPAGQDTARSPMMGASSPMHQGGPMGMHGRMDRSKMDSMVARHLSGLKAKLKLTAEQEGAWTTFTAAMKPPVNMGQSRPDRAEMDKLSTPERIDRMRALRTQRMADMNAAMDKRDDATKAFYAALSADQKTVFDAEHTRMGRGHGHGEHWGRGAGKGADKPAAK
jgi:protein CpxP